MCISHKKCEYIGIQYLQYTYLVVCLLTPLHIKINTTWTYSTTEYTKTPHRRPPDYTNTPLTGHDSPNTPPANVWLGTQSMDYHQSTPRDDGADDVLDDDGVLDVDDDARVVREVRFTRACCVSRARTRAMHEFLNVDRVPMIIIHHLSFTRDDGRTNGRTNATRSFEWRRW